MGQTISRMETPEADVVLRPNLGATRGTDFASRSASVLAGEQAVSVASDQIRALIERKKRELGG
jgi:NTE family protein